MSASRITVFGRHALSWSAILGLCSACGASPQRAWVRTFAQLPIALSAPLPAEAVASSIAWWSADSVALLDERTMQIVVRSLRDGGGRRIGRQGSGPGEFRSVAAIAVGETVAFVADPTASQVTVVSRAGDHLGAISVTGLPLELLRWSADTAALFTYRPAGTIGAAGSVALLARGPGGWTIVAQRPLANALEKEACPGQSGARVPYEPPVAGAASGRLVSLDPFTLGGLSMDWSDSIGTRLPVLCPPVGPMTPDQRQRSADALGPSVAGLNAEDRQSVENALRAYAGLTQPIALASRLSRAVDGRWWIPLELPSEPGILLGLGGEAPLVISIPEHILDVDWLSARTDSLIGIALVRRPDGDLMLRRIAAPVMATNHALDRLAPGQPVESYRSHQLN